MRSKRLTEVLVMMSGEARLDDGAFEPLPDHSLWGKIIPQVGCQKELETLEAFLRHGDHAAEAYSKRNGY